jgi:LPS export ABC transporter protein LptC/lipopolysaccharide transport protein LptA
VVTTRGLRRGLLALFLAVLAATYWTLGPRPGAKTAVSPEPSATPGAPKDATRAGGIVYRNFKEGEESRLVEAESVVGKEGGEQRLNKVKLTLGYLSNAKKQSMVITSDDCVYDPGVPRAAFDGHVVLTTSDGLELKTDSLIYRGDKGFARTEAPAQFKRKAVSGSSTGMLYSATEQRMVLEADAKVRIDSDTDPPTFIQSRQAILERSEGTLRFEDDSVLTQGDDILRADRLILSFDSETQQVTRAVAAGGVDLRTSGARALPGGSPTASKGPRHLLCRKLDIAFRPDRTMQQVIAQKDVDLTLLPGPREVKERHHIRADSYLIFDYDEQGRVVGARGARDASLLAEPLPERGAFARTVACQRFQAALDPETGEVTSADFYDDVLFTRGTERGRGGSARYDGTGSVLTLQERPEVEDDKGKLSAKEIRLATQTGDAEADGEVNHVLRPQGRPGLLSGKDVPTLVTSRTFSSVQKTKTATYSGGALLRSGRDEVRASSIVLREDADGKHTMTATESVVSLLNPKSDKPDAKPPSAIEGRGDEMVYEEAKNLIAYSGNTMIRQGDIVTRSPKAAMTLTADGAGIETLVAGEPVEVQQGDRRASGTRGTYNPGNETMVLVGDNAMMLDPQHQSHGRSLTFHVGDNRILVDGQQEGRTETLLQGQAGVHIP